NLDDLVAFLLDQIGEHHAGEQHGQQEEHQLPGLSGAQAGPLLAGAAGGDGVGLHVRKRAGGGPLRFGGDQSDGTAPPGKTWGDGQRRPFRRSAQHAREAAFALAEDRFGIEGLSFAEPCKDDHLGHSAAELELQPLLRGHDRLHVSRLHRYTELWRHRHVLDPLPDAAGKNADDDRKERAEQEEEKRAAEQDRNEIAARDDIGGFEQRQATGFGYCGHAVRSASAWRACAAASTAIATNASWRPARSIDSESMPASPSINARSSGSTPLSGSGKCQKLPSRRASSGKGRRQGPS